MRAVPEEFIFATKASASPALLPSIGKDVGKLVEYVNPVIYALPDVSTAMSLPQSPPLPPRYVE